MRLSLRDFINYNASDLYGLALGQLNDQHEIAAFIQHIHDLYDTPSQSELEQEGIVFEITNDEFDSVRNKVLQLGEQSNEYAEHVAGMDFTDLTIELQRLNS